MSDVPNITLNDGNTIPQLGFGTFQIDPEDTVEAVSKALEIGYRHIDTAQMYGNEKEVGEAIRNSGIERSEIFVTSKLNNSNHEPDDARESFDKTLSDLGLDYVDLFLIHWPLPTQYNGDFVSTWQTMEEFKNDGRSKSIGVSNFQPDHLDKLASETDTIPAINQIEVHPYFTNDDVRAYGQEHEIATEAWSPIAQGEVLDDSTLNEIAEKVGKSDGSGRLEVAHPARRYSVPEVGHARAHARELRPSSTSSSTPTTWRPSPPSTKVRTAAPVRTRTSSTTSPAKPLGKNQKHT